MHRRDLLQSSFFGAAATLATQSAQAAIPKAKVTRVRFYRVSDSRPIFNQSGHIVTVETDAGITGIGEGGSPDTVRQLGAMIIGENPFRIEHLWQLMYRGYFYPPGREKIHALGAIEEHIYIDKKPPWYEFSDDAPRLTGAEFFARLQEQ